MNSKNPERGESIYQRYESMRGQSMHWCASSIRRLPGQHFHLYLIAYGLFRFMHEFMRDTPRLLGMLSGYQIATVAVIVLGVYRFVERARHQRTQFPEPQRFSLSKQRW